MTLVGKPIKCIKSTCVYGTFWSLGVAEAWRISSGGLYVENERAVHWHWPQWKLKEKTQTGKLQGAEAHAVNSHELQLG